LGPTPFNKLMKNAFNVFMIGHHADMRPAVISSQYSQLLILLTALCKILLLIMNGLALMTVFTSVSDVTTPGLYQDFHRLAASGPLPPRLHPSRTLS